MQPHRYSRLGDLMDDFQSCFNEADTVYVTPVYAAGEDPVDGVSSVSLVAGMASRGHRNASTVEDQQALSAILADTISAGDIVVCLGAGDITRWAAELPAQIERDLKS
jgi:UDP-N-acetylmuramate--alanine ligase